MIFCSNILEASMVCISSLTCTLSRIIPAVWRMISTSSPPLRLAADSTWAKLSTSSSPLRRPKSMNSSSAGRFIRIPSHRIRNSSVIISFFPNNTSSSFMLRASPFSKEYPALRKEDSTWIPSLNCNSSRLALSFFKSSLRYKG